MCFQRVFHHLFSHCLYCVPYFHLGVQEPQRKRQMAELEVTPMYTSCSLDRKIDRQKQKSFRSRASRKGSPSVMKRSGSSEQIYTGTRVTEIPESFLVHLDMDNVPDGMEVDLNAGSNDRIHSAVEGKAEPSALAVRRMSGKGRSNSFKGHASPHRENTDSGSQDMGKLEDSLVGMPLIKFESELETKSADVTDDAAKDDEDRAVEKELQGAGEGQGSVEATAEDPGSGVSRISTASTDSGIAEETEREVSSHGASTENSPTEPNTRAMHLQPPNGLKFHLKLGQFDSLRFRTKDHRDSMMLSQLCVIMVSLPADIHQGQKGRGSMLKFRFSPYTQIESVRVAILKVSQQAMCVHICCYRGFTCQ